MIAEDLKGLDAITRPAGAGGFGFDAQWDGFVYDVERIVAGASVLTALHARGAEGIWNMAGFLAGYRFAFVTAGGGLLAVLLLSLLWPGLWSSRPLTPPGAPRAR